MHLFSSEALLQTTSSVNSTSAEIYGSQNAGIQILYKNSKSTYV
jgi:hypothetical protein